jgi:hypothetical protein
MAFDVLEGNGLSERKAAFGVFLLFSALMARYGVSVVLPGTAIDRQD